MGLCLKKASEKVGAHVNTHGNGVFAEDTSEPGARVVLDIQLPGAIKKQGGTQVRL